MGLQAAGSALCCKQVEPNGIPEPFLEMEGEEDTSLELPGLGSSFEALAKHSTHRRAIEVDKFLSSQKPASRSNKAVARAKIKHALRVVLPAWRKQVRLKGKTFSRAQLLERLVPKAAVKAKAAKLVEEAKKA